MGGNVQSLVEFGKNVRSVLRDVLVVFRQTYTLGLLSLALAIVIWFVVNDAQNPPKRGFFAGTIAVEAVNVPQGKAPLETAQVQVEISADTDVWNDLTTKDFKATVDLSGMTQTQANLPVHVAALRNDVDIIRTVPSSVDVTLEPITQELKPVKIDTVAVAPAGYDVTEEKVSPDTVLVSGPQSLVARTDAVWADLNLTGVQISMEKEIQLAARDKDGRAVDVNIEPDTAKVSVTVTRTEWTSTFPVNPSLSGNVASGYRVSGIEVDPPFVNVRGPVAVLQSITSVTTDTVPVDGAESDVQRSVQLRLPSGATVDSGTEVIVHVKVEPAQGQRNFQVAIQTSGLKQGLSASLGSDVVTVTLSGLLPDLDALGGDAITARIDLSGLSAGTYHLGPKIDVPTGTLLVRVSPPDIQVTVTSQ
jgi:YbbR domain-containing protein